MYLGDDLPTLRLEDATFPEKNPGCKTDNDHKDLDVKKFSASDKFFVGVTLYFKLSVKPPESEESKWKVA